MTEAALLLLLCGVAGLEFVLDAMEAIVAQVSWSRTSIAFRSDDYFVV